MTIINKVLPTTVVGSYPVVKAGGLRSLLDPLKGAVVTAVEDQLEAGIDIISDGQVRGDMVSMVTRHLPGIKGQTVTDVVRASARPITVADTQYALSRHPKVKGILTGPTTLAHALKINTPAYRTREELILDIAQALSVEAQHLERAGVTMIQIDEPILSTGAANLDTARQAVQLITSMIRVPACLHVCGDLTNVIDEVLKIQIPMLDFEFANNPANLELLSGGDLKGRMLGYGVVDSSDPAVESIEHIEQRIRRALDVFDPSLLLIDPDCGLRMLSRDSARGKLKNMVAAARHIRTEL